MIERIKSMFTKRKLAAILSLITMLTIIEIPVSADNDLLNRINSSTPKQLQKIIGENKDILDLDFAGDYKKITNENLIYYKMAQRNYASLSDVRAEFNKRVDDYIDSYVDEITINPSKWAEYIQNTYYVDRKNNAYNLSGRPLLMSFDYEGIKHISRITIGAQFGAGGNSWNNAKYEISGYRIGKLPEVEGETQPVNNTDFTNYDNFYKGFINLEGYKTNKISGNEDVANVPYIYFDLTDKIVTDIIQNDKLTISMVADSSGAHMPSLTNYPDSIRLVLTTDKSSLLNIVNEETDSDRIYEAVKELVSGSTFDKFENDKDSLVNAIIGADYFYGVDELSDFINNYKGFYIVNTEPENFSVGILDNQYKVNFNALPDISGINVTKKETGERVGFYTQTENDSLLINIDKIEDNTVYCIDFSENSKLFGNVKRYFKTGFCRANELVLNNSVTSFKSGETGKIFVDIIDHDKNIISNEITNVTLTVDGAELDGDIISKENRGMYTIRAEIPGTKISNGICGVMYAYETDIEENAQAYELWTDSDKSGYVKIAGKNIDLEEGIHQVFYFEGKIYIDGAEYTKEAVFETEIAPVRKKMYNIHGTPPSATVKINGEGRVGETLTGIYTYFDKEEDAENGTQTYWLLSNTKNGAYTKVSNGSELRIEKELQGKYVRFAVLPKNDYDEGEEVISDALFIEKTVFDEDLIMMELSQASGKTIKSVIDKYIDYLKIDEIDEKLAYPQYFYDALAQLQFKSMNGFIDSYNSVAEQFLKHEKIVASEFAAYHHGDRNLWGLNDCVESRSLNNSSRAMTMSLFNLSSIKSCNYLSKAELSFVQASRKTDADGYYIREDKLRKWSGDRASENVIQKDEIENVEFLVLYDGVTTKGDFPIISRDILDSVKNNMEIGYVTYEFARASGSSIKAPQGNGKAYISLSYDLTKLLNDINNAKKPDEIEKILTNYYPIEDYISIYDKKYINDAIINIEFTSVDQLEQYINMNKDAVTEINNFYVTKSNPVNHTSSINYDINTIDIEFNKDIFSANVILLEKNTGTEVSIDKKISGNKLTIKIDEELKGYTMYCIDISGVSDNDGNTPINERMWFRTGLKTTNICQYKTRTAYKVGDSAPLVITADVNGAETTVENAVIECKLSNSILKIEHGNINALHRGMCILDTLVSLTDTKKINSSLVMVTYADAAIEEFDNRDDVSVVNVRTSNASLAKRAGKEKIIESKGDMAEAWIYDDGSSEGYIYLDDLKVGMNNNGYIVDTNLISTERTNGWHQIFFDYSDDVNVDVYFDGKKVENKSLSIKGELGVEVVRGEVLFDSFGIYSTKGTNPIAENVFVRGQGKTGKQLTVYYAYSDLDKDAENGTIINWYSSDLKDGIKVKFKSGSDTILTIPDELAGKYISASVIPKNYYYNADKPEYYSINEIYVSPNNDGGNSSKSTSGGSSRGSSASGSNPNTISIVPKIMNKNPQTEKLFDDVDSDHWAYDAISNMKSKGVINGMGDGRFRPDEFITRAQMISMIVRALDLQIDEYDAIFKDVSNKDWFAQNVITAYNNKIITGDGDLFYPNRNITRQEMVKTIVCAYSVMNGLDYDTSEVTFSDNDKISEWAKPYVYAGYNLSLVKGVGNNCFAPVDNATRAQATVIINNLLNINIER